MVEKENEKDLDIINYSDIPYNYFNGWLVDSIRENANYIFDTDLKYWKKDELQEKQIIDIKDLDIKFRLENDYDDDFDYAVYCKLKTDDEWEYLDNITKILYEKRLKK